jgi:hypothetical protein
MEIKNIKIATDGWEKVDIDKIRDMFPSTINIETKNLAQFQAEIVHGIVIGIIIGGVMTGFLNAIGADAWNSLKKIFIQRAKENKHSSIGFEISNETSTTRLSLKTEDPSIINRAFETIDNALEQVSSTEVKSQFHFDNDKKIWIKIVDREFARKVNGIAATTTPVKKGDRTIKLTVDELKKLALQMTDNPLTLGHGGKQVGKITRAWVEDDKLMFEGGIYDGLTKEESDKMDEIIKSGGISISFKY